MRRRVRKISPFGWMKFKASLLRGLIKFKIFFLKDEYEDELTKSNLFHSTNADGKRNYDVVYVTIGNFLPLLIFN